jgi:hypothetical protein
VQAFLKHLVAASKEQYGRMVQPTELITKQCGNSYCGSTYAGLLSLLAEKQEKLDGKRVLLFSHVNCSFAPVRFRVASPHAFSAPRLRQHAFRPVKNAGEALNRSGVLKALAKASSGAEGEWSSHVWRAK